MRVATWNVNGLRARLEYVLLWLEQRRPDVVGIQELKLTDDQFPHDAFERIGYHAVTHGQKAWNGVAVLSRRPAEPLRRGLEGHGGDGARRLTVSVDGLDFTTVYVPNGKSVEHEDYPRKLRWLDALVDDLGDVTDRPGQVLCGDFNVCPEPIDSWNETQLAGSIFHTDAERERFRRLRQSGWRDALRESSPDLQTFSWWDYRGGAFHRGQGLRIDLILVSAPSLGLVREVRVDRDFRKKKDGRIASDHAPVILDLESIPN